MIDGMEQAPRWEVHDGKCEPCWLRNVHCGHELIPGWIPGLATVATCAIIALVLTLAIWQVS